MFNIMIHNESILEFIDYFCEHTNKVSPNNFDDKYQVLCKFNELK